MKNEYLSPISITSTSALHPTKYISTSRDTSPYPRLSDLLYEKGWNPSQIQNLVVKRMAFKCDLISLYKRIQKGEVRGADEFEDYAAALLDHGYSKDDFELSEQTDPIPAGCIYPETGKVTIKFIKTDVERSYKAGYGSHWVADFKKDLKAGTFKKQQG